MSNKKISDIFEITYYGQPAVKMYGFEQMNARVIKCLNIVI